MKADDVTIADYRTKCDNIVDSSLESRKNLIESNLDDLYNSGYSIVDDEKTELKKRTQTEVVIRTIADNKRPAQCWSE